MAPLLQARDVSKAYAGRTLFEGLSLAVAPGERLGMIGPNGAGKSTLLRIMAGLDQPDTGQIIRQRETIVAYVPQQERFDPDHSARQAVADGLRAVLHDEHDRLTRAAITLGRIGFDDVDVQVRTLSGGWRKRLGLACGIAQQPDLLILDEPTNHLDVAGIVELEQMLTASSFAMIVVTHDRRFLRNVARRTIEISPIWPGGCLDVAGGYDEFLRRRDEALEARATAEQSLSSQIRDDDRYLSRGPKARTSWNKSRVDAAAQRREELNTIRSRQANDTSRAIEFGASERKTNKLLVATNVSKALGGQTLFSGLELLLSPGKCVGICGRNGSGKTTLLRVLCGDVPPDTGTVKTADQLRIVRFSQHRESLDPTESLERALCPVGDRIYYRGKEMHVHAWATKFGFRKSQLKTAVGDLSGGEQARVLIARFIHHLADVLVLDEPTNDLDIPSLEVLEQALSDFPGAVMLVSHDRTMLENVCTEFLGLDGQGGWRSLPTYEQWEQSTLRAEPEPKAQKAIERQAEKPRSKQTKLSYMEQRELDQMEKTIEAAERRMEQLRDQSSRPDVLADHVKLTAVCRDLEQAQHEVHRLYDRWQELEQKREALESA